MLEIDDSAIIGLIRSRGPIRFADMFAPLSLNRTEHDRLLDRQLQRLRRVGIIRYQPVSPGSGFPKAGWVYAIKVPGAPRSTHPTGGK